MAQLVLRTPAAGELLRLRHDGFQLIWRADSFEITQELGGKPVSMLKIAKNNSDGVPLPPLPH
ncbi:MAG: hypothetical protein H6707_03975 [Deltaproteobacteria bacterium]|nr:hypothetical protein [Deltaproteobacteria bacterium]